VTISTTIKREWWNEKMKDADNCTDQARRLFMEYKENTPFWNKRLSRQGVPCDGVFLVGCEVHRVKVVTINLINIMRVPNKYRGVMNTPDVWEIVCEVVR